jgi:serine/threonine protein kinase
MSTASVKTIDPALKLNRQNLSNRTREILNRGGWGNPDVLLVETPSGAVVVKDYSPRSPVVRRWLGPWLLRREAKAYRRLAGIECVPRLLGNLDALALVFEYRSGRLLSRSLAGKLPPDFMSKLQDAIAEMHRRGVVHLDLRHRSNILADHDGRPVVLDFASALCGRSGVLLLGWLDRRALHKWRSRLE